MSKPMDVDATPVTAGARDTIDESLYSRQLYVLGKEAMQKMATSAVLIIGVDGVGVEIAKNLALAGVKSLTLLDDEPTLVTDLGSQFFLREADIGKPRAAATAPRLAELNQYVPVDVVEGRAVDHIASGRFSAVVLSLRVTPGQALEVAAATRSAGARFTWAATLGVTGFLFNDFGPAHTVIDTDGEEPLTGVIATIDTDGEVFATESARHGLDDGAQIEIYEAEPAELNGTYTAKVVGPLSFNIGELPAAHVRGGLWRQVKLPATLAFEPLAAQLAKPEFFVTDFAKFDRPPQLHVAIQALLSVEQTNKSQVSRPHPENELLEAARAFAAQNPDVLGETPVDEKLLSVFGQQAHGDVAPVNAVIGATAAQEVLKAVSGKFTPVRQWLYYDAFEALPPAEEVSDSDRQWSTGTRYSRLQAVFGSAFLGKLANQRMFLVGAGAIGCEVLKNWALLGVGTGDSGSILVTDNDTIERSNLNRQFLFRPKDVGRPKSETAAAAVADMNPDIQRKYVTFTDKVGPDTQDVFDDSFWERLDIVTNALDNVEARTYVDRRCVFFRKPLIESGTLGTKGNVQVVVPDLTESYSSSHDPPEQGIPLCTLRSFPSKIDHTIAWAKTLFESLFDESPQNVNQYLSQPNYVEGTLKQAANQKAVVDTIYEYLVAERPLTFEQCISWAVEQFERLFRNEILQLLYNFPADAKTTSGAPFWAPPKRLPAAAHFSLSDPNHYEFVVAAANLRAFNYGLKGETRREVFEQALGSYSSPVFEPSSSVKIQASDDEPDPNAGDAPGRDEIVRVVEKLPAPASLAGFRLQPVEFEKDDDANFHIDFINAASNLRASNYRIEPVDRSKTKFIAGRIIPAIATTTALVTGLATLEALKVLQEKPLDQYKNGFVNLALPFFGFSEPIASSKLTYNGDKQIDKTWGRFTVNGNPTLGEFLDLFQKEHGLEVSMIAADALLLYASFHPPAKVKERKPLRITELIELVSKKPLASTGSLTLEVTADDEEGEEVDDLPFVIVRPNAGA